MALGPLTDDEVNAAASDSASRPVSTVRHCPASAPCPGGRNSADGYPRWASTDRYSVQLRSASSPLGRGGDDEVDVPRGGLARHALRPPQLLPPCSRPRPTRGGRASHDSPSARMGPLPDGLLFEIPRTLPTKVTHDFSAVAPGMEGFAD